MQNINNLNDLLAVSIKTLYAAEDHILKAMPAIIEKVNHSSLKNALTHHLGLSGEQMKRLNKIMKLLPKKASEQTVEFSTAESLEPKGIIGLIDETNELLGQNIADDVTDSLVIAGVQKIEHYEISCYGSALAFARQLKLREVEVMLQETLDEEYDADDLLTALATSALNKEAAHQGDTQTNEKTDAETEGNRSDAVASHTSRVSISERTINAPGGRAGTSHRGYGSGESRGH